MTRQKQSLIQPVGHFCPLYVAPEAHLRAVHREEAGGVCDHLVAQHRAQRRLVGHRHGIGVPGVRITRQAPEPTWSQRHLLQRC